MNSSTGTVSGALFKKGSVPAMIPRTIMIPPMVGVPCFFRWLSGPSLRTFCPNFMRCSTGIMSRHRTAHTANEISSAQID